MNGLSAGLKSPKTTIGGWLGFAVVLLSQLHAQFDADPSTLPQWGVAVTALIAAVTLTFARDADKSSETAGAK